MAASLQKPHSSMTQTIMASTEFSGVGSESDAGPKSFVG